MRNQSIFTLAPSVLATGLSLLLSGCGGEEEVSTASTDTSNSVASQMAAPAMGAAPSNAGGGMSESEMGGMESGGGGGEHGGGEHGGGGGNAMGGMERGMVAGAPAGGGMGGTERGMINGTPGGMGMGMDSSGGAGMQQMEGYGEPGSGYAGGEYSSGGYPGGGYPGGGYPGGGQMSGGMGGQGAPATDYTTWTRDDFLEAVRNRDRRILVAIPTHAESKVGDQEFAGLMTDVLAEMSGGGGPARGGSPGFPPGYEPGGPKRGGGPLTPPGGASFDHPHRLFKPSGTLPVDSLDVMIGQSILTYLPQAAQGTRGAASSIMQRSSGSPGGNNSSSSPPGGGGATILQRSDSAPGSSDPSMEMEMEMEMESEMSGGYDGYPSTQGNQPAQPTFNPVQPGLKELELVQAVVSALVRNNTLPGWQTLKGIVDGSVPTTLSSDENIQLVVTDTFSAEDLNADMAEQILNAGIDSVLNAPVDHPLSLEVMAVLSSEPLDHFFGFANAEAAIQSGTGNAAGQFGSSAAMNSSGMGQQPGMSRPGLSAGGMGQQPGMSRPGLSAGGMGQEPGMSRPGLSAGGMGQEPGMSRPGLSAGGMGAPSMSGSGMGGEPGYGMGMSGEYGAGGYPGGGYPGAGYPGGNIGGSAFNTGTAAGVKMLNVSLAGQFPAAKALWSKSTTQRLAQLLPSNSGIEIVKLAASIPSDDLRHGLFAVMQASYDNGATDTFGSLTPSMLDPGMLPVLKALPRVRPVRGNAAPDPAMASKETWVEATKMMVLSLRERLRVAASNPALAYSGAPKVRLHRDAVAQQSIAIVLPTEATEPLGDSAPSPTKIYYVKTSVTPQNAGQQNSLIAHYEKYSKGFQRADPVSGIMWFDGVTRNTDGTRQTIDILIQKEGAASGNQGFGEMGGYGESSGMSDARGGIGGPSGFGGGGQSAGGSYSIEIIVVITRDPVDELVDSAVTATN